MNKIILVLGLVAALATLGQLYRHHSSSSQDFLGEIQAFQLSGPVKAIYIDYKGINWNDPAATVTQAVDAGYNLVILAFYLKSGPADMAVAWQGASGSSRSAAMSHAHSKGAKVIVSAGGSTDDPYSSMSGSTYGNNVAKWAVQYGLDGVDFDMENFSEGLASRGLSADKTIQWLADATNSARQVLGNNRIITHAPQSPYFGKIGGGANPWTKTTGGYTAVYKKASTIDYFLIQFYNQGGSCYTDYNGLFKNSCSNFKGTSVKEISDLGIPLNKIVVGKPVASNDASNGWVSPNQLGQFFKQAKSEFGWNGGVMGWAWASPSTSSWVKAIYN